MRLKFKYRRTRPVSGLSLTRTGVSSECENHCFYNMQIIQVLVIWGLISVVELSMLARIFMPRQNLTYSQKLNIQNTETLKYTLPEERRQLSLFPKSNKKFVVSTEPNYKFVTSNPIIQVTKRPVMKKLLVQNRRHDIRNINIEQETKRPLMNTRLSYDKKNILFQKTNLESEEDADIPQEISHSKEKYESEINHLKGEKEENPQKEYELIPAAAEGFLIVTELIFTQNEKTTKPNSDNSGGELPLVLKDTEEGDESKEYVCLNSSEYDTAGTEDPEEFVTSEVPKELIMSREKRSNNVIEEENLATTVSGYKYTWRDKKLNDDLTFKNINS